VHNGSWQSHVGEVDNKHIDAPVDDDDEAQAHAAPLDIVMSHDNMIFQQNLQSDQHVGYSQHLSELDTEPLSHRQCTSVLQADVYS